MPAFPLSLGDASKLEVPVLKVEDMPKFGVMRSILIALFGLLFSATVHSQTVIRGDQRVVFDSDKVKITEKHVLSNYSAVEWSWEYEMTTPHFHSSGSILHPGFPEQKVASFRTSTIESSIRLMQECLNVLQMQARLGSHDRIIHEFDGVDLVRFGNDPDVISIYPGGPRDPVTGLPVSMARLLLSKSECTDLLQRLKHYASLQN